MAYVVPLLSDPMDPLEDLSIYLRRVIGLDLDYVGSYCQRESDCNYIGNRD